MQGDSKYKSRKKIYSFLYFSIKNESPKAMPTIPLDTACSRVEPKNLSCPVSRPTVVSPNESGLIKNKVFSSAANPSATVIKKIGQSMGSSIILFYIEELLHLNI